eukprot:1149972-Pelagomonas_calceolata.AAC.1
MGLLLLKEVLHAHISLSSRTDSCWTSHLLTALDGLAHSDLMRRQIVACDPMNLGESVVDLGTRHLSNWTKFIAPNPKVNNSKRLTYHQWCALPVRDAHAIHPPYTMPKYMYLDLPHHVLRNTARFWLRVHILQGERLWSKSTSPVCDICDFDDIQDGKHVLFRRSNPQASSQTS